MSTINSLLDFVLVGAAIWMVFVVRGLGGVIGKGLNWITIGALVLGIAHLLDTIFKAVVLFGPASEPANNLTYSFVHRIIVLAGFVILVVGFQQIRSIKRS